MKIANTWITLALLFPVVVLGQQYKITDLGALPHTAAAGYSYSYGLSINVLGEVVGQAFDRTGESRAFLWTDRSFPWTDLTGMRDIGTLSGCTTAEAYSINTLGQVVGGSCNSAFIWTEAGGIQSLGTLPGDGASAAYGVNEFGLVVGVSQLYPNVGTPAHAFRWTSTGGMSALGVLGGASYSVANSVNDAGQIVGYSGNHAFLWTQDTGMQDLGTAPGGTVSTARAINNLGTVVGYSSVSYSGCVHAMRWTATAGMQDLGTLAGVGIPGCSDALGVNDFGQVVGTSDTTTGANTAMLWTEQDGMRDLNTLISADSGWLLNIAASINNAGQITGVGYINGNSHAFLLTPTPKF